VKIDVVSEARADTTKCDADHCCVCEMEICWDSVLRSFGAVCGAYYGYQVIRFLILHFLCRNKLRCYGAHQGKWVLVTGSSAGIGEAFVEELARRGMNIILVARPEHLLKEISAKLEGKYGIQTRVIPADCGNVEDSIRKISNLIQDLPLTMLINNVGVEFGEPSPLLEKTVEQVDGMIDINIRFTTLITIKLLPQIMKNTSSTCRGAIVNVASVAHNVAPPMVAVYSGTKSFTTTYSKSLSSEMRTHYPHVPIDVLCIRPGFVETKMSGLIANSLKGFLLQVMLLW
jgi:17beta-estradiol 17-dehydrogenase / very-long-chain 3-oxoacyl-CoA reductase